MKKYDIIFKNFYTSANLFRVFSIASHAKWIVFILAVDGNSRDSSASFALSYEWDTYGQHRVPNQPTNIINIYHLHKYILGETILYLRYCGQEFCY